MGRAILITGGTRSGKSTFGESLLKDEKDVLYIATSKITDREMEERVKRHRERRPSEWSTYEGYRNLSQIIEESDKKFILFECVGTMVTNILFDEERDFDTIDKGVLEAIEKDIKSEFRSLVEVCKRLDRTLIIITNEVGMGLISEYPLGRIFTDILGRVNQELGALCSEAYFVACGIPLRLK
ncbi:MAG: bifunctional adenosylcobinamide kinase/adenosylcobinamide-phosphate guanylyltransferase [Clostridiaceae bacterium]